jgi:hypothetical protein
MRSAKKAKKPLTQLVTHRFRTTETPFLNRNLAYASADSKSAALKSVSVRLRPRAPTSGITRRYRRASAATHSPSGYGKNIAQRLARLISRATPPRRTSPQDVASYSLITCATGEAQPQSGATLLARALACRSRALHLEASGGRHSGGCVHVRSTAEVIATPQAQSGLLNESGVDHNYSQPAVSTAKKHAARHSVCASNTNKRAPRFPLGGAAT